MGLDGFGSAVEALPTDAGTLIADAVTALGVPPWRRRDYLAALLLDINGWAGWCAWHRWQAGLAGSDDPAVTELLAVRLAWEWLLHDRAADVSLRTRWRQALHRRGGATAVATAAHSIWLAQQALEIAYQEPLARGLSSARPQPPAATAERPAVQAAFCIDVRSEVLRRALERAAPRVQTLGVAGFFGLAAEYTPLGSSTGSPRLPGLLSPRLAIRDACDEPELGARFAADRRARLAGGQAWAAVKGGAVSAFPYVEATGLGYGAALLAATLGRADRVPEEAGLSRRAVRRLRPRLDLDTDTRAGLDQAVDLAASILRAMSLRQDFARLVLLAGHGAGTVNNPHAAALECGACGGHSGAVSARALAALLNEPAVRRGLVGHGIRIPEDTWFLGALHNTTTDEVTGTTSRNCAGRWRRPAVAHGPSGRAPSAWSPPPPASWRGRWGGGPGTGRRSVRSGASPATPRSLPRRVGARPTWISVAGSFCTTTAGATTPTARCWS